jgi:arginyl-tRNA synthetase
MVNIIKSLLKEALLSANLSFPKSDTDKLVFSVELQANPSYGDFSTNLAFQLASILKEKPYKIAAEIVNHVNSEFIDKVEIKGGGFINIFVKASFFQKFLRDFLQDENRLIPQLGDGKKIQVEFVSANPTGPLHIGHGRGASFGDSISRILDILGYKVTKEYYINDRGNQITNLGKSVYYWYMLHFGKSIPFPEDGYKGEYIKIIAEKLIHECKDELVNLEEMLAISRCAEYGKKQIMENIIQDLNSFNVYFDKYFSETDIFENNYVDETLNLLKNKGMAYKNNDALWLKTTAFGDDKDRVLIKSTGEYTYFASDIAYHRNKFERGFDIIIDVWGADHHGYVKRMKAALQALGYNSDKLKIVLIQMVNLIKKGEKVSMSTRANEFIPLSWLIKEVGKDAARFFYCLRSPDSHFDFNIDLAKEKSSDNPVYYVQYAYARIKSLFRNAHEKNILYQELENLELLVLKEELNLIKNIQAYFETLINASILLEPNKLATFLIELASNFHYYYNNTKIVDEGNIALTNARLNLCKSIGRIIQSGLNLLGVDAPERM